MPDVVVDMNRGDVGDSNQSFGGFVPPRFLFLGSHSAQWLTSAALDGAIGKRTYVGSLTLRCRQHQRVSHSWAPRKHSWLGPLMGTFQLVFNWNYGWCLDSPSYASVRDIAGKHRPSLMSQLWQEVILSNLLLRGHLSKLRRVFSDTALMHALICCSCFFVANVCLGGISLCIHLPKTGLVWYSTL